MSGRGEVVLTIDVTVTPEAISTIKAIVADHIVPVARHVSIVTYADDQEATDAIRAAGPFPYKGGPRGN